MATNVRKTIVFGCLRTTATAYRKVGSGPAILDRCRRVRRHQERGVLDEGETERVLLDPDMEPVAPPNNNRLVSRSQSPGLQGNFPIGKCTPLNPTPICRFCEIALKYARTNAKSLFHSRNSQHFPVCQMNPATKSSTRLSEVNALVSQCALTRSSM